MEKGRQVECDVSVNSRAEDGTSHMEKLSFPKEEAVLPTKEQMMFTCGEKPVVHHGD